MDQRATHLGPEALLRRDVARIHVNVSYRHTHGVGGRELRRKRGNAENSDSNEAFDTHSNQLYQALRLLASPGSVSYRDFSTTTKVMSSVCGML